MTQRREAVIVTDSFGDWTPITVHLTGEISARDRTAPYKGSMFAAYPGDIVFSKIDARSGAIGMLPAEIEKAVVTPEFPVFTADPARLDGEFVKLVLRTGGFIEALRRKASGTSGRKRITPEAFQDLRIPLPPLPEQQAIVAAWRAALNRALTLERDAAAAEAKAAAVFETALGFAPATPLPDRPVFVAKFKNLDRWGHEPALRRTLTGAPIVSAFSPRQLGDLVHDVVVGWSPKCLERPKAGEEWGVLKLSAVTGGHLKPEENKALRPSLKPKPELEIKKGDVLITRGSGVTRLVGAATFVDEEPPSRLMICDLIFRVVFKDDSEIDAAFLAAILATSELRSQIEDQRTGAAPMMQKTTKTVLMGLTFPLPPKPEQENMVKALADARAEAATSRAKAVNVRAQAWSDFEAAVYAAEDADDAADLIAAAS
jgi:type I restriction enzyme S subunit